MCILSPSIAYAILVQKKLVGINELKTEIEPWLMDQMRHAISKYDLSYTTINMVSTTGNNSGYKVYTFKMLIGWCFLRNRKKK